jgi:subtilisin family serine protease
MSSSCKLTLSLRAFVRWLPLCLLFAIACDDPPASTPRIERAPLLDGLSDELRQAFAASDEVSVIVNLRESATHEKSKSRHAVLAEIQQLQEHVLARPRSGLRLAHRYRSVPAFSAHITRAEAVRLLAHPDVASIYPDSVGGGQLKEAVPAIGGDQVQQLYGLSGKGVRVAVLDTGVVTEHPDLKSSVVAQHCFTRAACPPRWTSESDSAEDNHGHGTHAVGIISSDGVVAPAGFAPAADIVAIKVNDRNNAGVESDWVAGLDWLLQNQETLQVRVVNLSLGTTEMHGSTVDCDRRHAAMARAIKNLIDAGIVVFAASGNAGTTSMLPSPACNTGAITVGATYDAKGGHQPPGAATYHERWGGGFARCGDDAVAFDQIACFTNATERLDLLAPGGPILSTSLRGMTETYWGTSQSCPVAAAIAALMLECNPSLTPQQIKDAMVSTGTPVLDRRSGLSFPSLRALEAVRAACPGLTDPEGDAGLDRADGGDVEPPAHTLPDVEGRGDASVGRAPVRDAGKADAGRPRASQPVLDREEDARNDDEDEPAGTDDRGRGAGASARDSGCTLAAGTEGERHRNIAGWLLSVSIVVVLSRRRARRLSRGG